MPMNQRLVVVEVHDEEERFLWSDFSFREEGMLALHAGVDPAFHGNNSVCNKMINHEEGVVVEDLCGRFDAIPSCRENEQHMHGKPPITMPCSSPNLKDFTTMLASCPGVYSPAQTSSKTAAAAAAALPVIPLSDGGFGRHLICPSSQQAPNRYPLMVGEEAGMPRHSRKEAAKPCGPRIYYDVTTTLDQSGTGRRKRNGFDGGGGGGDDDSMLNQYHIDPDSCSIDENKQSAMNERMTRLKLCMRRSAATRSIVSTMFISQEPT